jgi:SAM-dependent methyltransferase
VKKQLRLLAQQIFPVTTRRKIVRYTRWPPVGWVRFGNLRRLRPISGEWGSDRGQPVDRYYIHRFLVEHCQDVQGYVLEIGNDTYTLEFGGDRVKKSEVLHVAEANPKVTVIGDLTNADNIPSNSFDCIILTQTLNFIFDVSAVIKTVFRILKPRGVVLVSVPGIGKISRYDMDRWGHYWSFTTKSVQRLFEAAFPAENIQVEAYGNVLASIAFLHGLAAEELSQKELNYSDPDFELLITVRAVKP